MHSTSTNSATLAPTVSNPTNGVGNLASGSHDAITPVEQDGNGSPLKYTGSPNGPERVTQPKASAQAPKTGPQLSTDALAPTQEKSTTNSEASTDKKEDRPSVVKRFFLTSKVILFHSWINLLLVFVPVGIAVNFVPNMSPGVIFAMNAIAIIPLAGLLSQATETVAHRMGDAIGALMNITFGNAVELIILYVTSIRIADRKPKSCLFLPLQPHHRKDVR